MHTIVADYPGPPGRGLPVLLDARHLFARAGGTDPYHAPRAGLEHGRALTRLGRYDDAPPPSPHRPAHDDRRRPAPRPRALAHHYLGELAVALGDRDGARTRLHAAALPHPR